MERNILLMRHGESIINTGLNREINMPDHAAYLTDNGKEQASNAGKFLSKWLEDNNISKETVRLWVSPYERTRQTAANANKYIGITDIREDDMLTELQFGLFNNLTKEESQRLYPAEWERYVQSRKFNGKFYARRPEGESPFDCEIRQKLFIRTLFRDFNKPNSKNNVIIVGHGAAITLFKKSFFHYSHEWYSVEPNPSNCSIQLIKLTDNGNIDAGYIYGYGED